MELAPFATSWYQFGIIAGLWGILTHIRGNFAVNICEEFSIRWNFSISSLWFLHASQPVDRSASLSRQDVLLAWRSGEKLRKTEVTQPQFYVIFEDENGTCFIIIKAGAIAARLSHLVFILIFGFCRPIPSNVNLKKERPVCISIEGHGDHYVKRVMQWCRGWVRTGSFSSLSRR